jgi:hypothetical protein
MILNLGLMKIRLDSASHKIKDLRDPEIVDPEINSGPGSG